MTWEIEYLHHWPAHLVVNSDKNRQDNEQLTRYLEDGWEPIAAFRDPYWFRVNIVLRRQKERGATNAEVGEGTTAE